jgi:hypothetical protein
MKQLCSCNSLNCWREFDVPDKLVVEIRKEGYVAVSRQCKIPSGAEVIETRLNYRVIKLKPKKKKGKRSEKQHSKL